MELLNVNHTHTHFPVDRIRVVKICQKAISDIEKFLKDNFDILEKEEKECEDNYTRNFSAWEADCLERKSQTDKATRLRRGEKVSTDWDDDIEKLKKQIENLPTKGWFFTTHKDQLEKQQLESELNHNVRLREEYLKELKDYYWSPLQSSRRSRPVKKESSKKMINGVLEHIKGKMMFACMINDDSIMLSVNDIQNLIIYNKEDFVTTYFKNILKDNLNVIVTYEDVK